MSTLWWFMIGINPLSPCRLELLKGLILSLIKKITDTFLDVPPTVTDFKTMSEVKATMDEMKDVVHKPRFKFKTQPGFVWNPLTKYPRNESCYCGSKLKFKKCCLDKETAAIPEESAERIKSAVKIVRDERK